MGFSPGTAFISLEHMQTYHQQQVLAEVPPQVLDAVVGGGAAAYLASRSEGQVPEIGFGRVVERLEPLMVRFKRHDGEVRRLPLVALTPVSEEDYKRIINAPAGDIREAFGVHVTTLLEAHRFVQFLTRRWFASK